MKPVRDPITEAEAALAKGNIKDAALIKALVKHARQLEDDLRAERVKLDAKDPVQ